jgi:hypothetical protein
MFTLDDVVPWGRSFDEYRRMFALTDSDLELKIVDCGAGPASFNVHATRAGAHVISCDPLYQCEADEIRQRIDATYDTVLAQTRQNQHEFVWNAIPSVEALGAIRMAAMNEFLADFVGGKLAGRYVEAELPRLPFGDRAFDLALCSHLLFLYTAHLDDTFHHLSILEMCRVAAEVRIFPLLALGATHSPHVEPLAHVFALLGFTVSVETVPYEFQRGGNQMMRIRR